MGRRGLCAALAAALWLLHGTSVAAERVLTVSAAASLRQVFEAIAPGFEAQHAGVRVRFNFGASDTLVAQVRAGAPVDVLATADTDSLARAAQAGDVLADSTRPFASNQLVVILPAAAPAHPRSLAELRHASFSRIAIGNPNSVPAGRYARRALEAAGVWQDLAPRQVPAQHVRQVLDYVARGEVDAGFVYATDVAVMPDRVRVAFIVPGTGPITYPAAVTRRSAHPALAQAFVAHLLSTDAQAQLAQHGFGRP